VRVHSDERRTAYCDLFDTPGDVNLFIVKPGQRTCWHRHCRQTDQFRVIRGTIRIGVLEERGPRYLDVSDPGELLWVEPGHWHGYENPTTEDAYLLMYLDRKYDPTDEERMSEAELPWYPT
jgi:quercetin dioxygenase-like cupin family protein